MLSRSPAAEAKLQAAIAIATDRLKSPDIQLLLRGEYTRDHISLADTILEAGTPLPAGLGLFVLTALRRIPRPRKKGWKVKKRGTAKYGKRGNDPKKIMRDRLIAGVAAAAASVGLPLERRPYEHGKEEHPTACYAVSRALKELRIFTLSEKTIENIVRAQLKLTPEEYKRILVAELLRPPK